MKINAQFKEKVLLPVFLVLLFMIPCLSGYPQSSIEWQKTIGTSSHEVAYVVQQTFDGGYVVAGYTYSYYISDFYIIKLDSTGGQQWQRSIGGSAAEQANAIYQTADGGYMVAGSTSSNNGVVTGNHGSDDGWIVKLDSSGLVVSSKCYGGTDSDVFNSIQPTSDGGYIAAGFTYSDDGDVSGNHGLSDCWVVKIDSAWNIQWQKALGSMMWDCALSIIQTYEGDYLMAGFSGSAGGNVTSNHGGDDYWLVSLSSTGTIRWQKSFGGSGDDEAFTVLQTKDKGYIISGGSSSSDGNVTNNHGEYDFWIIKLDSTRTIQWQRSLGGSNAETAYSIRQTSDGGFICAGASMSDDGYVSGNHGGNDYWIVKLDSTASLQWQLPLGGAGEDLAYDIRENHDGSFVIAGSSTSNNGDVSGNHGQEDFWVIKLNNNVGFDDVRDRINELSVYPNPATNQINLRVPQSLTGSEYVITNVFGQTVMTGVIMEENSVIEISALPAGVYLMIIGEEYKQPLKIIKK